MCGRRTVIVRAADSDARAAGSEAGQARAAGSEAGQARAADSDCAAGEPEAHCQSCVHV